MKPHHVTIMNNTSIIQSYRHSEFTVTFQHYQTIEDWTDEQLQVPEVSMMLESFRWIRCSFTWFQNPAHHFLHSLRLLATLLGYVLTTLFSQIFLHPPTLCHRAKKWGMWRRKRPHQVQSSFTLICGRPSTLKDASRKWVNPQKIFWGKSVPSTTRWWPRNTTA